MLKRGIKRHLFSGLFAILVIGMLLLTGPAQAIQVSLTTPDINVSTDVTKQISILVDVDQDGFLPILSTDIDFTADSFLTSCSLSSSNVITGCDFLNFVSKDVVDFIPGFGYGYGYGADTPGAVLYTFDVNVSNLPIEFIGKTVDVEAFVNGQSGQFSGSSSFSVSGVTNAFLVGKARDELNFGLIKANNALENEVKTNLNLPTITTDGVMISWSSTNNNRINPFNGAVTRPGFSESDHTITLTATLSKGTSSVTKDFTLIVLKEAKSDAQSVSEALPFIDFPYFLLSNSASTNVLIDLFLPTSSINDVKVTWSSSDSNVIQISGMSGIVSRKDLDKNVVLTAVLSKGSASQTKIFNLVVKGTADLDLLALSNAKQALIDNLFLNGNPARNNIISNLNLPTSIAGHSGVVISWNSTNTTTISATGVVTRDSSADKNPTLTATFTKNGKTVTKSYSDLIVKKQIAPAQATSGKQTELQTGQNEVKIDSSNIAFINEIKIPNTVASTEKVTLNLQSIKVGNKVTLSNDKMVFTRENADANLTNNVTTTITVELPQGTEIDGGDDWNGLIQAPTVEEVVEDDEFDAGTPELVISVGVPGKKLILSKATKILIPGSAGKRAGFTDENGAFVNIPACTAGQIADPDTLDDGADCYTTSESDLLIWTKHFTQFFSFTPNAETCNGLDDDGDSEIDEGVTSTFYADDDDDGYGNAGDTSQACSAPSGYVNNDDDCDDTNDNRNPGESEVADGIDNDCDASVDEGFVCINSQTQSCGITNTGACQLGTQTCTNGQWGSCAGAINPTSESCNVVDDDCDGSVDENNICAVSEVCDGIDNDLDGQIDEGGVCVVTPPGPTPTEVCDGFDNDFDGLVDEGVKTYFFRDVDGDSFGDINQRFEGCSVPNGYVSIHLDCNDNNANISPATAEMCDGVDNNCNGQIDDHLAVPKIDNQKGVCLGAVKMCQGAAGWTDPSLSSIPNYESNELTCDGKDNDCDGEKDENHADSDKDGIKDCVDTNTDNDHVNDLYDSIYGTLNDIEHNLPGVDITLDGISLAQALSNPKMASGISLERNLRVIFMNGVTKSILEGRVEFIPKVNPLNLYNVKLFVQEEDDELGSLFVTGINPIEPLTAYVDRLSDGDYVCVADNDELDSIDDLSNDCQDDREVLLDCLSEESADGFRCLIEDNRFKVSGFDDAVAVREFVQETPPINNAPVLMIKNSSGVLISELISSQFGKSVSFDLSNSSDEDEDELNYVVKYGKLGEGFTNELGPFSVNEGIVFNPLERNGVQYALQFILNDGIITTTQSVSVNFLAFEQFPGDFTGDQCVRFADFLEFVKAFNSKAGDSKWNPMADFTGDGRVKFDDFLKFVNNFNKGPGCTFSKPSPKPTLSDLQSLT